MKILVAHNFYQFQGGEDTVFASEKSLLVNFGHEVVEYVRHNKDIAKWNLLNYPTLPLRTVWNWETYTEVKEILLTYKPDIAHFHNTFPLISPSVYAACWECNVPVVQSLHNSRLICPSGALYSRGGYCQACVGKAFAWTGVARGCYRGSRLQTGLVAAMTSLHGVRGTWSETVSRYIVFNRFFQEKFTEAGLPTAKLAIKPHFLDDPGPSTGERRYVLYVGRLSEQKGLRTLLEAWKSLPHIPLKICGDGELELFVRDAISQRGNDIQLIPFSPRDAVMQLMKGAAFLMWPSEITETFGLVALEAFACGTPVISSGVGAMPDLVAEGETGLNFRAGDPEALARCAKWAWDHPAELRTMGRSARRKYELLYTPERNHDRLIEIYKEAMEQREVDAKATSYRHLKVESQVNG